MGFVVRGVADERQVTTWEVASVHPNRNPGTIVLHGGYKTEDEALSALDEFLSAQGIEVVAIQPPVTAEEVKATEEEEEEN